MTRTILDLCGGTGSWSKPYQKAGYDVILVTLPDMDVRDFKHGGEVHGIFAAPPCTMFASSGARWKRSKEQMRDAISIVDACFRIIMTHNPQWWVLENPIGTLKRYIGKPRMYFQPYEYGDPYTKRTCLWGNFDNPKKNVVRPTEGSKMHLLPPGEKRQEQRSITPQGFAQAFFEANP